jgi:hypothetical protein
MKLAVNNVKCFWNVVMNLDNSIIVCSGGAGDGGNNYLPSLG